MCVQICVPVCSVALGHLSLPLDCNLSSHPLSPWKTGKPKILLCISRRLTHSAHTHILYVYIRRVLRYIRPHTNTPQSVSLYSLPQPNCAEDTFYLTTLPSPDTSPHKCVRVAAHTHTNTLRLTLPLPQRLCQDTYRVLLVWKELYRDVSPCSSAFCPPKCPACSRISDCVEHKQLHIRGRRTPFTQYHRHRLFRKAIVRSGLVLQREISLS